MLIVSALVALDVDIVRLYKVFIHPKYFQTSCVQLGGTALVTPVHPVSTQVTASVVVAISTFQAIAVVAFGVVVPVDTDSHCPADIL